MSRQRWVVAGLVVVAIVVVVVLLGRRSGSSPPPATPTSGSSAARPPAPPETQGEQFGANVNRLFQNPGFTGAVVATQLAALRATGATIARCDALWEFSEPTAPVGGRHRYDWRFDDRVAGNLAAHDLRWLPIVDYSAGWAQSVPGQDHSPPASDADFADYAAAVAARYGPGGAFWASHPELPALPVTALEVWNEPDNPTFWVPAPDPARYAQLYLHTRDAVAAAAPGVRVLVGGLWHAAHFLPAVLAAAPGLGSRVDGIAVHPYGASPAAIVAAVGRDRRLLTRLGMSRVPLWVTEFGWTTSPPGARDYLAAASRPGYLADTLTGLARAGCGVAAVLAYTWVSEQQDPGVSAQWYGIAHPDGSASPDAAAFAVGLREAQTLSRSPGACPGR